MKYDDSIISSVSTTTDSICQINSNQSTHVSYNLFSKSKTNLILTKENLSQKITSDYIDWTNYQSNRSSIKPTITRQLDTINFLKEYLENENSNILIDLLYETAREINVDQDKNDYYHSAVNNNHLHLTPIFKSNLQLSNNKEKKNKKEKSIEKEKKDDKKKEEADNEMNTKKPQKSKDKAKKIEDTISTTDSDVVVNSPSLINPTHIDFVSPKSPSYSPVERIGFPSLSIPVPQHSNIAHLSQVKHQLQIDPQNPSLNKTTYPHNMSVQQQLQSLSQMARDGDEILITLSVNALTQNQRINNNNQIQYNQPSFQNNPYPSQPWNQTIPTSTEIMMPRNLEIVAKGFARVQNEPPQPSPSNPYPQQQQSMMPSYNQLPFAPRYPMPCYSSSGPPQIPIGPPIQPIFAPPNMMMSGGFTPPLNSTDYTLNMRNNFDNAHSRSHKNTKKCDYLCQSSLHQPDFRGRPSPGIMTNPYFSNSPSSINFSAKRSSKHKTKCSSSKNKSKQLHNLNFENINRTYSSIY